MAERDPPGLPAELLAHLVSYCDSQATLACCCLVSWTMFREASRVLYGDVVLARHGAVDQLFSERVSHLETFGGFI